MFFFEEDIRLVTLVQAVLSDLRWTESVPAKYLRKVSGSFTTAKKFRTSACQINEITGARLHGG